MKKAFHIKLTAEFKLYSDADARCDLQQDVIQHISRVIKYAENRDEIYERLGLVVEVA